MNLTTIAEFVENQEILKRVQELGIDYVQGYAIGRPCPLEFTTSQSPVIEQKIIPIQPHIIRHQLQENYKLSWLLYCVS